MTDPTTVVVRVEHPVPDYELPEAEIYELTEAREY